MTYRPGCLGQLLARAQQFQLHDVTPLERSYRGSLIHCTFDAHLLAIPPLDELVLRVATAIA